MIDVPGGQFNLGEGKNLETGFQDEQDQILIKGQLGFSNKLHFLKLKSIEHSQECLNQSSSSSYKCNYLSQKL